MSKKVLIITTTLQKREDAEAMASSLVARGVVACVQITGPILSFYKWDNEVKREHELVLRAKTAVEKKQEVTELIKSMHPYELPQIIFSEAQADDSYSEWVMSQTRG